MAPSKSARYSLSISYEHQINKDRQRIAKFKLPRNALGAGRPRTNLGTIKAKLCQIEGALLQEFILNPLVIAEF